jgi:hypothetical protein
MLRIKLLLINFDIINFVIYTLFLELTLNLLILLLSLITSETIQQRSATLLQNVTALHISAYAMSSKR